MYVISLLVARWIPTSPPLTPAIVRDRVTCTSRFTLYTAIFNICYVIDAVRKKAQITDVIKAVILLGIGDKLAVRRNSYSSSLKGPKYLYKNGTYFLCCTRISPVPVIQRSPVGHLL